MALDAVSTSLIVMKPKPRERPVRASYTITTLSTSPTRANSSSRSRSVVRMLSPNTPMIWDGAGDGREGGGSRLRDGGGPGYRSSYASLCRRRSSRAPSLSRASRRSKSSFSAFCHSRSAGASIGSASSSLPDATGLDSGSMSDCAVMSVGSRTRGAVGRLSRAPSHGPGASMACTLCHTTCQPRETTADIFT